MNKDKLILIDMDGVCVNFVRGVCDLTGVDYNWLWETFIEEKIEHDICKALDVDPSEFWKQIQIDGGGKTFWRNLPELPLYRHLLEQFHEENWMFCTSPSLDPQSAAGKIEWIQMRHSKWERRYVITPHKEALAQRNTLLIDDKEENCKNFIENGGSAIHVPTPWNKWHRGPDAAWEMFISEHINKFLED